jgi:hypothetical protein
MPRPHATPADHYLLKTMPLSLHGCWLWVGYRNRFGYGEFKVGGKTYMPHRWAYEVATGDTLGDRHAHHLCHNPQCVNPLHIEPMTGTDHVNIHVAKTRREMTHCKRGHPLSGNNVYVHGGRRHCKSCATLWRRGTRSR